MFSKNAKHWGCLKQDSLTSCALPAQCDGKPSLDWGSQEHRAPSHPNSQPEGCISRRQDPAFLLLSPATCCGTVFCATVAKRWGSFLSQAPLMGQMGQWAGLWALGSVPPRILWPWLPLSECVRWCIHIWRGQPRRPESIPHPKPHPTPGLPLNPQCTLWGHHSERSGPLPSPSAPDPVLRDFA